MAMNALGKVSTKSWTIFEHKNPRRGKSRVLAINATWAPLNLADCGRYDANTRHCMYGLDADLMILGLLSHEPYFFLLREEVTFGKSRGPAKKELDGVEQKTWHLLSLTLFRDYLNAEFSVLDGQVCDTKISFVACHHE